MCRRRRAKAKSPPNFSMARVTGSGAGGFSGLRLLCGPSSSLMSFMEAIIINILMQNSQMCLKTPVSVYDMTGAITALVVLMLMAMGFNGVLSVIERRVLH